MPLNTPLCEVAFVLDGYALLCSSYDHRLTRHGPPPVRWTAYPRPLQHSSSSHSTSGPSMTSSSTFRLPSSVAFRRLPSLPPESTSMHADLAAQPGVHSRESSSSSATSSASHLNLSEARRRRRELEAAGLEGSSWLSRVEDRRRGLAAGSLSEEEWEELQAKPTAVEAAAATSHSRLARVFGADELSSSASRKTTTKALPRIPPQINLGGEEPTATLPAEPPVLTSRTASWEQVAKEQIQACRSEQVKLAFRLQEIERRAKERGSAELAARQRREEGREVREGMPPRERADLGIEEKGRRARDRAIDEEEGEIALGIGKEKQRLEREEAELLRDVRRRREESRRREERRINEGVEREMMEEEKQKRQREKAALRDELKEQLRRGRADDGATLTSGFAQVQLEDSTTSWRRRRWAIRNHQLLLFKDATTDREAPLLQLALGALRDGYEGPAAYDEESCLLPHSCRLQFEPAGGAASMVSMAFQDDRARERFFAAIEVARGG